MLLPISQVEVLYCKWKVSISLEKQNMAYDILLLKIIYPFYTVGIFWYKVCQLSSTIVLFKIWSTTQNQDVKMSITYSKITVCSTVIITYTCNSHMTPPLHCWEKNWNQAESSLTYLNKYHLFLWLVHGIFYKGRKQNKCKCFLSKSM